MTIEALAEPDERLPAERLPDKAAGAVLDAAAVAAARPADGAFIDGGADGVVDGAADRAIGVRMIDGGIIEVLLPPNEEIRGAGGAHRR